MQTFMADVSNIPLGLVATSDRVCRHCHQAIFDNGTTWVHRRFEVKDGRLYLTDTQWCDVTSKQTIAEALL